MIRRILKNQSNTIASAAIIVASFSVLSRVVGFLRDRILAGEFGASSSLDAYFVAFRLPDLFYQLVVVGALSASFIPLFTKYYSKNDREKAWFLTSNMLNILTLVFGALAGLAALLAPVLIPLIAGGLDAETQSIAIKLTRVMLLAQVFLAASMIFGSALQGAKYFLLYSLAPIFYNLGIIGGVIFFVPAFGLQGLAWGVVLGGFMHFLIQLIGIKSLGFKYQFVFKPKDPDVRYTLKHMPPRLMGLAVNQVNFLAMTGIASYLAAGSVTILQFAYNLNFFPIGVVAVSYAIAAFPTLCEYSGEEYKKPFIDSLSSTIRQMMLFIAPATVLMIGLRAQIVRVVLGAGKFSWEDTILTANTLAWFSISLMAQAIVFVLIRAYFAKSDTKTPFFVGVLSTTANVVAAIFLSREFGATGLGMAYSISAVIQLVLLWIPLRKKLGTLDERRILRSGSILLVAAILCAFTIQGMKLLLVNVISLDTFFGVLGQGAIAGVTGLVVYAVSAYLMRSEEMNEFLQGMKRRLVKKAKPEEPIVTAMEQ